MKKLFLLLCLMMILFGCKNNSNPSSESSRDSSTTSNSSSEIRYSILGEYRCSSDYWNADTKIERIPYIYFFEGGNCKFFVNYLGGTCDVAGVYSIEGNKIKVELDFQGTIFEGTGTEYMDNQYVFTIIDDNQIIIDRGYYAVEAGDPFIRYPGNE